MEKSKEEIKEKLWKEFEYVWCKTTKSYRTRGGYCCCCCCWHTKYSQNGSFKKRISEWNDDRVSFLCVPWPLLLLLFSFSVSCSVFNFLCIIFSLSAFAFIFILYFFFVARTPHRTNDVQCTHSKAMANGKPGARISIIKYYFMCA